MNNGRASLDLVVHDEANGFALNMSLLSVTDRQAAFAGVLVLSGVSLVLASRLVVSTAEPFPASAIDDQGSFAVDSDGETEDFEYQMRAYEIESPYRLVDTNLASKLTGIPYRAFALDDPFPLLILPIAAGVAGIGWLARRHAKQDKSASEVIGTSVQQAMANGRPIEFHQVAKSRVRTVDGTIIEAESIFDVRIGERPAA